VHDPVMKASREGPSVKGTVVAAVKLIRLPVAVLPFAVNTL